MFMIYSI